MTDSPALRELSQEVFGNARTLGLALMQANYVERPAWELPGGRIRGLAKEAGDLAVGLRDSIWIRYDGLTFHHRILQAVQKQQRDRLQTAQRGEEEFHIIWTAVLQQQYIFDDIIFNSASLFDYLGNAIWFGCHGQNHVKKKWNRAYKAAKDANFERRIAGKTRIAGSATGHAVIGVHEEFVDKLYEYRSDLIHHRVDAGTGTSRYHLGEAGLEAELRVTIPKEYGRRLKALVPETKPDDDDPDMLTGTEHLIRKVGLVTRDLLATLTDDLGWDPDEGLVILG